MDHWVGVGPFKASQWPMDKLHTGRCRIGRHSLLYVSANDINCQLAYASAEAAYGISTGRLASRIIHHGRHLRMATAICMLAQVIYRYSQQPSSVLVNPMAQAEEIRLTHQSGSFCQPAGRLTPGCGHAGQKSARSPFPGNLLVS